MIIILFIFYIAWSHWETFGDQLNIKNLCNYRKQKSCESSSIRPSISLVVVSSRPIIGGAGFVLIAGLSFAAWK